MRTLSDTEAAYLAGIIDGEGTVCLNRSYAAQFPTFQPLVAVTSTDIELLTWIKERAKGTIIKQKRYVDHHTQAHIWRLKSDGALALLARTMPFMVIERKKVKAEALVTNWKRVTPRNGYYTEEMRKQKLEFVEMFRAL